MKQRAMNADVKSELESLIRKELPRILKEDPKFRFEIIEILSETFYTKEEIRSILEEIKSLRRDFNVRFEEHSKILEGHSIAIKELTQRLEEHSRILEGHSIAIRELIKSVEEHSRRIDKMDIRLSAIGARWGIMAESAFRDGLRGIFEERFGVKVSEWITEDIEGLVFGHRCIVQADVVVRDSEHWLVAIKSSASQGDVSTFNRLGELYQREKGLKPRLILVTPFIEDKAKILADKFNMDVYTSL